MINWNAIESVFLDMDGTLLDLHFDNHFWREFVPQRYAQQHDLDLDAAKATLFPRFSAVAGTLDWYCVDYWSNELGLDIPSLKQELHHLISVHPHVVDFLDAVRRRGKRLVLVTNAHQKSLRLKMERTQLAGHFDAIICTHEFGIPKEHADFWSRLQKREPFDRQFTLLVDDSVPVLKAARDYGISHLLAVRRPDTQSPPREVSEFAAIDSFLDILPE